MKANIKLGVILTDSFRSYGRHWKPLLAVGAATVMMNLLPLLSGTSDDIVFKQLIALGMGFFLAPIFTFGLYRYLLKVWNGEQLGWKELLYYCGNLKRYGHTLLFQIYFGLLMLVFFFFAVLVVMIVLVVMMFSVSGVSSEISSWFSLILYLLLFAGGLWLEMRLFLVFYCYLFQEEVSAWQAIGDSFSLMKGNCWKLLLLMIVQGILGFLCIGIILLLFVGMEHIDFLMAFVENGYIPTLFLFFAVGLIFTPLYWLMNAGFAYKVIQQTDWANQSEVFNHIVDEP